jgi:uncharacterized DUF497 family protein
MNYEWDEAKRKANIAKHGIDFANALHFDWEGAVIRVDDREDYGELREIALGFIGVRLHVVAYTPRGDDTARIIMMRKATRKEVRAYEKAHQRQ